MGTGSGGGRGRKSINPADDNPQEQSAPRKRGFFSKLLDRDGDGQTEFFGDKEPRGNKVTHTETGGGVGVAVTVNNVGTVSAQPSGW